MAAKKGPKPGTQFKKRTGPTNKHNEINTTVNRTIASRNGATSAIRRTFLNKNKIVQPADAQAPLLVNDKDFVDLTMADYKSQVKEYAKKNKDNE
jgi:hypothetical protein